LAEYWNGATWSIQSTPNPPNTFGGMLQGVACSLPTTCIAVGFSFAYPERVTLGERYSG